MGLVDAVDPEAAGGPRVDAFNLHKSIGLTILALMMVRLAWRVMHPAPALPAMPRWQTWLARSTHVALYAALLIQPFAGYLGSVFSGYPVKYFGMTLPAWGVRHEGLKDFLSIVHLCTSFAIADARVAPCGRRSKACARRARRFAGEDGNP